MTSVHKRIGAIWLFHMSLLACLIYSTIKVYEARLENGEVALGTGETALNVVVRLLSYPGRLFLVFFEDSGWSTPSTWVILVLSSGLWAVVLSRIIPRLSRGRVDRRSIAMIAAFALVHMVLYAALQYGYYRQLEAGANLPGSFLSVAEAFLLFPIYEIRELLPAYHGTLPGGLLTVVFNSVLWGLVLGFIVNGKTKTNSTQEN